MKLSDIQTDRLEAIKTHPDQLSQAQLLSSFKKDFPDIPNEFLARYLGIKPSGVSHMLRVVTLPEIVIDGYLSKQISFTHLILISRLKEYDKILSLYEEILSKSYTVSQTEVRIREILFLVDNRGKYIRADELRKFEERISRSMGVGVKTIILQTRIKGKITIEFAGNLENTSEKIESFVQKFRSRKSVSGESVDTAEPGDENVEVGGGTNDLSVVADMGKEIDDKYRFDPDY
jgi:hypothetical protein